MTTPAIRTAAGRETAAPKAAAVRAAQAAAARAAAAVANDLCRSGNLVTYIEREGCDYTELWYDFNRGWEAYYYDERGALVGFALDNAFGGSVHCGVAHSCIGDIIQDCVVCRASWPMDIMPGCPTTLWKGVVGSGSPHKRRNVPSSM